MFGILATIAIALVIKSSIEHKHISWIESLKLATNKWPKVIATVLLAGLLTMLLFLLLIVPGIIFMIYWQFIIYVVIFSDKWGSEALDYSKTIVKKRWWKTFGFALVIFLASMLWAVIIGSIGGFFAGFFSVIIPKAEFIVLLVGKSIWAVTYAFFSVLPVIWYLSWDSSKDTTSIKSNAE